MVINPKTAKALASTFRRTCWRLPTGRLSCRKGQESCGSGVCNSAPRSMSEMGHLPPSCVTPVTAAYPQVAALPGGCC